MGLDCLPLDIFVTSGYPAWDISDLQKTVLKLQDKGYSIEFHEVLEGHTWGNWRGLSDEMLMHFFGAG